jgi:RNA polymerase sigma factor for flagellar operon FliA
VSGVAAYTAMQNRQAERLVREHLPLVRQIALHLSARLPAAVELDDLMQVGLIGLLKASEQHDSSRGASFSTYAGIRIKGAMLDELRRHDWLPRSVQGKLREVAVAIAAAEARLGRAATDADIAAELELPLDDYRALAAELACARMLSLEETDEPTPGASLDEPLARVGEAGFRRALVGAVEALPDKEKLMMSLYYEEGLNLREIGLVLDVSESRVSQLHGQALARLRARLADWRE